MFFPNFSLLFFRFWLFVDTFFSPPLLPFLPSCVVQWWYDDCVFHAVRLLAKGSSEKWRQRILFLLIICEATLLYQYGTMSGLEGPQEGGKIIGVSANISVSYLKWVRTWSHSLSIWLPSCPLSSFLRLFCFHLAWQILFHQEGCCSGVWRWPGTLAAFYQLGACQTQALYADKVEPISCLEGEKNSHCACVYMCVHGWVCWVTLTEK